MTELHEPPNREDHPLGIAGDFQAARLHPSAPNEPPPPSGWVFYDNACLWCVRLARRFGPILRKRGIDLAPLQTPWAREKFGTEGGELLKEMRFLTSTGRVFGGADALIELSRHLWWSRPIRLLTRIPGGKPLLRAAYRWVAARRGCLGGRCELKSSGVGLGWLLAPALILLAWAVRPLVPAWVYMWGVALTFYALAKWLTLRQALAIARPANTKVSNYLLAWVGMDARTFLFGQKPTSRPSTGEWLYAAVKSSFGASLIWGVTRLIPASAGWLQGWVGMIGCIFLLHFGLFHLLALAWRRAGIDAVPIMRAPVLAVSLAEFWGKRWNLAFHQLAQELAFRPLRRRWGAPAATLCVFALSGLVHEAVISLPAHGGYGLPTLYFLIQGFGLLWERSRWGRWLGIGSGCRGWIWTFACTAAPVALLFHPLFITNVILPFLRAIGAI